MKRGFTLIEILLALLLLTLGIISVVGVLTTALGTNEKARSDIDGVSFADLVLNHCHAVTNWNALPATTSLSLTDDNGDLQKITMGSIAQYTSQSILFDGSTRDRYTVSYQLEIQQNGDLKAITLKIWPGYGATGLPRIFQTEIYNWSKSL